MKILQRYILDELKLPFLLCFLILNFIFQTQTCTYVPIQNRRLKSTNSGFGPSSDQ